MSKLSEKAFEIAKKRKQEELDRRMSKVDKAIALAQKNFADYIDDFDFIEYGGEALDKDYHYCFKIKGLGKYDFHYQEVPDECFVIGGGKRLTFVKFTNIDSLGWALDYLENC